MYALLRVLSGPTPHDIAILSLRYPTSRDTLAHPAAKGVRQKEFGKKVTKKVTKASEKVTEKWPKVSRKRKKVIELLLPHSFCGTLTGAREPPQFWKKRSENLGWNLGVQPIPRVAPRVAPRIGFSHKLGRECHSENCSENTPEFRELLREWPFHSESVFFKIGVVPRFLRYGFSGRTPENHRPPT